ncbi:hypothetical protein [Streptomyces sp. NPDC057636]|uniref:hypothetical protein n=1 Tax=Streptomyces sp. NPDC057636 TaxID=3346189 RepID=UPI0036BFE3EF
MAADPFSPPKAIEAAEGRAADLIGLRGRMTARNRPVVTEAPWLALVIQRPVLRAVLPRQAREDADNRSAAPA